MKRHWKLIPLLITAAAVIAGNASAEGITDAVVRVFAGDGAGCGTLIHAENGRGWVLTAAHVLGRAQSAKAVWHDGQSSPAEILAADQQLDVALLSVAPPEAAPTIPLAADDQWPARGETVELIGYGGGRLRHWQATVNGYALTDGINRYQTLSLATQTIGGDSGGAMVYRGRLVGVIWGGPLAGPRGPMLATHGTCCIAIQAFLKKQGIQFNQPSRAQFSPPSCSGPFCPLPPQRSPPRPTTPDAKRLIEQITQLESRIAQLERNPVLKIDLNQVSNQLIDHIASDDRFRGPPGKDGRDGADGRDASNVNVDQLADQVKQRLAGAIRIRVESVRDKVTR